MCSNRLKKKMKNESFKKGLLLAVIGAILWGTFGPFLKLMGDQGLSDDTITALAPTVMFIFFGLWCMINPKMLKINWKMILVLIFNGVVIINGMNYCYVNAVMRIPI